MYSLPRGCGTRLRVLPRPDDRRAVDRFRAANTCFQGPPSAPAARSMINLEKPRLAALSDLDTGPRARVRCRVRFVLRWFFCVFEAGLPRICQPLTFSFSPRADGCCRVPSEEIRVVWGTFRANLSADVLWRIPALRRVLLGAGRRMLAGSSRAFRPLPLAAEASERLLCGSASRKSGRFLSVW